MGMERRRGHGIERVETFIVGLLYVMVFSVFAVLIMVKTKFNNRLRIALLAVIVLTFFFLEGGHLITLIPKLMGSEGVSAVAGEVGSRHILTYSQPMALIGLLVTLSLTFILGRAICGYGCPVGAVQELLYDVPADKKGKSKATLPARGAFVTRLAALVLTVCLYLVFDFDLIQLISPYQFWEFEIMIPGFFIIISFFVTSLFLYRPFCRLFCPYGAVASPVAKLSRFKLEKGKLCVECGLCDSKCPTGEINEKYGECYLCGRCLRACNKNAIVFCQAHESNKNR